jgi:hypothetical protein
MTASGISEPITLDRDQHRPRRRSALSGASGSMARIGPYRGANMLVLPCKGKP